MRAGGRWLQRGRLLQANEQALGSKMGYLLGRKRNFQTSTEAERWGRRPEKQGLWGSREGPQKPHSGAGLPLRPGGAPRA